MDVERGLSSSRLKRSATTTRAAESRQQPLQRLHFAVDANTGKMKWYQQLVHHDIWDYDLAAPPCSSSPAQRRVIPARAQITKMGMMFVFNRETGEPMYGMEERPVPQTTAQGRVDVADAAVPAEAASRSRAMSLKKEELAKVTPELEAYCKGLWEKYNLSDAVPYDAVAGKAGHRAVSRARSAAATGRASMFNKPLGLDHHECP